MRYRLLAAVFAVAVLAAAFGAGMTGMFVADETTTVKRVVDGDTLVLESGESVRLLGIDTPERGQRHWLEAKSLLEAKVMNRSVRLEKDVEDKDKYGRLLRWIFAGDEFVNAELVKAGYARTLFYGDVKYRDTLQRAEAAARAKWLRVWDPGVAPHLFCLGVYTFRYNAPGDDRENLAGEFVEFRNACQDALDVTGWRLEDSKGQGYVFGSFAVGGKSTFRLRTGQGDDNETDLFWGLSMPVWNNDGDRLRVWTAEGELALDYSY